MYKSHTTSNCNGSLALWLLKILQCDLGDQQWSHHCASTIYPVTSTKQNQIPGTLYFCLDMVVSARLKGWLLHLKEKKGQQEKKSQPEYKGTYMPNTLPVYNTLCLTNTWSILHYSSLFIFSILLSAAVTFHLVSVGGKPVTTSQLHNAMSLEQGFDFDSDSSLGVLSNDNTI